MDPRARLPLAVLVVAVVLGVLTGAAAVAGNVRGEGRPAVPMAADVPSDEPLALRVLRGWDLRRARAYARADDASLAGLYVPGSRTGAADRDLLRAYRERGLRVLGMRTRVLEAHVVQESDSRICVVVTDVLVDAMAVDAGDGASALPRDGPSTRRVVLVREHGRWVVAEAYAVD